ncbi:MAG TPA: hypothetical protein VNW97_20115 [Candidatus Saccharimonadales bacterium]|jgi:hypothetical protein|nr:hypothetical protein [Candidatus Saccharimonadales bacterium]
MSTPSSAVAQIAKQCEPAGMTAENGALIASELAKTFAVKDDEVGMLCLEKDSLVFVYPAKLHNVGRIPLNSPASQAARTAHSRRPEINNAFFHAKHTSFFETVDVSSLDKGKHTKEEMIIQKLMSAPVVLMNQVVGVIQICRKGKNATEAGPDFVQADLLKLVAAAAALAVCFGPKPTKSKDN